MEERAGKNGTSAERGKMISTHKKHSITISARPIPDSKKWAAKVIVSWIKSGRYEFKQFRGPIEGFNSEGESEFWGVQFGKNWINHRKPDLRK